MDKTYSSIMLKCHNQKLRNLILETYNKIPLESLDPHENATFDPHLTILYGITTSKVDEILKPLVHINFINYKTIGTSLFTDNEKYDVLKIDIDSIDLRYLNKKCRMFLKHVNFHPKYIPHITIAYLKKNQSIIEKLTDLNYYKNIHDVSHTISIHTADNKKFLFNLLDKKLEQIKIKKSA